MRECRLCARSIFASPAVEAVECARRDVILGVGHEYVSGLGMDRDAVRNGDLLFGAVGDEILRHPLMGADVDYAVADGVGSGVVAPFGGIIIEGVASDSHVGAGNGDRVAHHHLVVAGFLLQHIEARRTALIVTSRRDPYLFILVFFETVKVDPHRNLLHLLEIYHLDHGDGVVVVGGAVTARIGHIHIVVDHLHLFGLIPDGDFPGYGERGGVDFIDRTLR